MNKSFYHKTQLLFLLVCLLSNLASLCANEKQKICLNMIVKNEKAVITRCLNSLLPLIDYWVIDDTGSTEGTQKIIKDFMKENGIPGELFETKWVNFEHNRNEALKHASGKGDYLLFIDADEYLIFEPSFKLSKLDKDCYFITITHGDINYGKLQLLNNKLKWKWKGVLHEGIYPVPENETRNNALLEGVTTIYTTEGARSKDPLKYQKDAELLEAALKKEPNNSRYQFYLARSYRDFGNLQKALENFEIRVKSGGWDEEVFESLLEIATIQEKLNFESAKVIEGYKKAFQYRPSRAEPLYYLSRYYGTLNKFEEGYKVTKIGTSIPLSDDILFVQKWIYDWGMLLELSVNAYWTKKYEESQLICLELLKNENLPEQIRKTVQQNLNYANSHLLEDL